MVKDRLRELHNIRKKLNLEIGSSNNEIAIQFDDGDNGALLSLLDKIGPLYTRIKELHKMAIDLRKSLNDHSKREKLADKIADVKDEARSLYNSIKEVSSFIDSDAHLLSHVANSHHMALVTFFSSANGELSNLQLDLREKHKKYVEKELRITGQEVSEVELEALLDRSAEVFNKNLLKETQVAKQLMLDVQQRHEDVVKIEQSIVEVNQLFQDLAILVREQGEKLDRIENYVFEAQERAHMAHVELKQASTNQTKARKKKVICFIILGVVIFIIILAIVLSFV